MQNKKPFEIILHVGRVTSLQSWVAEKNAVSISVAFCLDVLIRNKKYNFQGMQNKKPFEIILHVGRVTSLQSWVAKTSCHGQTFIYK